MGTGLNTDRLPQGPVARALSPSSLDASDAAQGNCSVIIQALWVVSCLAVLVGTGLDLPKAFAQGNRVYVDQAYSGAIEDGSAAHPFREFTAGARSVPPGGTVFIAPGQYAAVGTYATPMTLQAPSGGVVLSGPLLAGCPIAWGPTVLTPVFYGIQDFDPSSGAPGPLRVFYPTIDGAVHEAPLLRDCGRYPLVVFLHGHCPQATEHYRAWVHLPAQLARSGYVVVVPQLLGISAGTPPFAEASTDLTLVEKVLAWVRREWAHRDQLMLPPATGIVGHSYGALLGGRLATSLAASAFVSLSGGWTEWSGPLPRPLGALRVPALLTWGGASGDIYAVLEGANASLWDEVDPPKHQLVFQDGHHWDYLPADQLQCGQTAGPCDLVKLLAADYTALFLSRYLPPPAAAIPRIPPTLQPPEVELTPEQQRFAGGQLLGLSLLPDHPHCTVRHRWTDTSACPPARPICCAPGPDAKTCLHCIPRGSTCPWRLPWDGPGARVGWPRAATALARHMREVSANHLHGCGRVILQN